MRRKRSGPPVVFVVGRASVPFGGSQNKLLDNGLDVYW